MHILLLISLMLFMLWSPADEVMMFYTFADLLQKGAVLPEHHEAHFSTDLGVSPVYQVKPREK